jgi:hypothetical protein
MIDQFQTTQKKLMVQIQMQIKVLRTEQVDLSVQLKFQLIEDSKANRSEATSVNTNYMNKNHVLIYIVS